MIIRLAKNRERHCTRGDLFTRCFGMLGLCLGLTHGEVFQVPGEGEGAGSP